MLQSLLKTLVQDGVTDFAFAPVPIGNELPYYATRRSRSRGSSCPTGLVHGTILDTKALWSETTVLGCGDARTTHEVPHRNGVLVRLRVPDPKLRAKLRSSKHARPAPHSEVRPADDDRVFLVMSHQAAIMPWKEYAPVADERQRLARESKERYAQLDAVADELGIPKSEFLGSRVSLNTRELEGTPKNQARLRELADFEGDHPRWHNDSPTPHVFFGEITLPYARARELAEELRALREANASLRDDLESAIAQGRV